MCSGVQGRRTTNDQLGGPTPEHLNTALPGGCLDLPYRFHDVVHVLALGEEEVLREPDGFLLAGALGDGAEELAVIDASGREGMSVGIDAEGALAVERHVAGAARNP